MIRLLKASAFYDVFLDEFYRNHPEMHAASYELQYRSIMDFCFGWSDFWKINLEKTEKFIVLDVITNAKILQQQWAKEKGISFSQENWMYEILKAQIDEFQPDVFFPHDYFHLNTSYINNIRKEFSSIKLVISYDGFGLGDSERFRGTDLMLSCTEYICDFYRQHGYNTFFLPFGFESSILTKIQKRNPIYDVSFIGSVIVRKNFHTQRLRMLSEVSSKVDLSLWAASFPVNWQPWKKDQLRRIKNQQFQEFWDVFKLGKINKGTKSGIEMYQCLADSKFTLNKHIDVTGPDAGNSRIIEATGVGTCLVTDWKPNLHKFFKLEEEIVTFKTSDEAIEKILYLLKNENERKKIADAGQARTLKDHSFYGKITEIAPIIENLL